MVAVLWFVVGLLGVGVLAVGFYVAVAIHIITADDPAFAPRHLRAVPPPHPERPDDAMPATISPPALFERPAQATPAPAPATLPPDPSQARAQALQAAARAAEAIHAHAELCIVLGRDCADDEDQALVAAWGLGTEAHKATHPGDDMPLVLVPFVDGARAKLVVYAANHAVVVDADDRPATVFNALTRLGYALVAHRPKDPPDDTLRVQRDVTVH